MVDGSDLKRILATCSFIANGLLLTLLLAGMTVSCSQIEETQRCRTFIFHHTEKEKKLAVYLQDFCETIEQRVEEDLGLTDMGEIQVELVSTEEEFLAAQPVGGNQHKWASALAYPSQGRILMKSPKLILGGQPLYEKIFFHEVAHIALDRALRQRAPTGRETAAPGVFDKPLRSRPVNIPRWLHEGYAVYLSRDWSLNREVLITRASMRKELIPLGRLVASFPEEEEEARLAYAQSADLVHYLIHRYGNDAFHRFLGELGKGGRFGHACRYAFGEDFLSVEKKWRKHLKRRYSWVPLLGSTGTLWFLACVVFLAAYLRKKLSSRAKLARWSEEEPP